MRDSADVILALPQRSDPAQAHKPLIAVIVIGLSLAIGYGASRMWPLPIASQPPLQGAAMTQLASPATKDELVAPASLSALDPSRAPSHELASTLGSSGAANTVAPSATSSENCENRVRPASVEPAGVEPPSQPLRAIANETSKPLGHRMNRGTYMYRAQFTRKTPVAGPAAPEFAPNPQPNQPSRDFMSNRSR